MRLRLLVALAALVLPLVLAAPAEATLPSPCHLDAGKMLDATSTANRSIEGRWPGFTCSPGSQMAVKVVLWVGEGSRLVWDGTRYALGGSGSMAGASIVTGCPHRSPVKLSVDYRDFARGTVFDQVYWLNWTVCS